MKIFSVRDLLPNTDRRSFPLPDSSQGAEVVFLARDESWRVESSPAAACTVVVMQGRGHVVHDSIEHPICAFDVVVLEAGVEWSIRGDDVDPAVILVLGAGG